jgi:hypothetical protein
VTGDKMEVGACISQEMLLGRRVWHNADATLCRAFTTQQKGVSYVAPPAHHRAGP